MPRSAVGNQGGDKGFQEFSAMAPAAYTKCRFVTLASTLELAGGKLNRTETCISLLAGTGLWRGREQGVNAGDWLNANVLIRYGLKDRAKICTMEGREIG